MVAKFPQFARPRHFIALLAALVAPGASWNKDGYPDCVDSQGPDCTPNRRANYHHSLLDHLFNKWCSDKGTYWLSKHNYGAAYDTVLRPTRKRTRNLVELGVGDETAGSLNAWREYFPRAEFWILDIDVQRFKDQKQWAWASRQKRRHGCHDDPNVWTAPRVHPLFGVNSSNRTQLRGLPIPDEVDVIIDDASHALAHQLVALEALWPKLRDGGFYIVEDLTIGALPWMRGAEGEDQVRRAPTNNTNCGHECHYVQRPSEHPFLKRLIPTLADQSAGNAALSLGAHLPRAIERILDENAWFYTITGAHVGGGLDSTVIIQKTEKGMQAAALDEVEASDAAAGAGPAPDLAATATPAPTARVLGRDGAGVAPGALGPKGAAAASADDAEPVWDDAHGAGRGGPGGSARGSLLPAVLIFGIPLLLFACSIYRNQQGRVIGAED